MASRRTVTALALIAATALSGCGGDQDTSSDPGADPGTGAAGGTGSAAVVLTEEQARTALIGLDELGDGFRVAEDDDDDDSSMGCLDDFEGIDKIVDDPVNEAERDYEADSDFALPGVFSAVASFDDVSDAEKGMAAARAALENCTEIDETDDGTRFVLTIASDDRKAGAGADDQLNLNATGTLQTEGVTVPMAVHMSLIRIDNHVAMSGIATMAESAREDADEIAAAALARFAAVIAGKPVPEQSLELDELDLSQLFGGGAV